MKTFCFECKHDCHCNRKCDYCSCYICNNIVIKTYEANMGGKMIDEVKQHGNKIVDEVKNLWGYHTFKVAIVLVVILLVV